MSTFARENPKKEKEKPEIALKLHPKVFNIEKKAGKISYIGCGKK